MRILYNSQDPAYKTPFGTLVPGQLCVLRLALPRDLETRFVQLVVEQEDGRRCAEFAFAWAGQRDADYDLFKCDFCLPQPGLFYYWFRVTAKTGTFRLFKQDEGTNMEAGDKWQLSVIPADFTVPGCFRGRVMYQIFPDRFCKEGTCDTTGKLEPFVLRQDWGGQPQFRPDASGEVLCNDFFGGNLRGIASKLPYLHDLGAGVLYLNPISMAFSNHRYDTADYLRPDPLLGTEEDFRSLCEQAHRLGMKVLLDGVYSHTGANSVYFDREGIFGSGAYSAGPDSPYYSWYSFGQDRDHYDAWWGFKTLPNVNELDPAYQEFIIDGAHSVIAHWLALGADGFRLDVADELPDAFILRFKRRLRDLNPQALLLGEVWEDASNKCAYGVRRRYFVDGELDSVMNYVWRGAILAYARGQDDGTGLGRSIMTLAENYPPQVLGCLMNILGTHDTPRILTMLAGDFGEDKEYLATVRLSPAQRAMAFARLRLAAFLQFTLPGCPCIYYGDEAGMEGCKDPFNRGCYPWGQEDGRFMALYRALAGLKNQTPALADGDVRVTRAGGGAVCFTRSCDSQQVLCCVNRGHEPLVCTGSACLYADGAVQTGPETWTLPANSCAVLLQ